MERWANSGAARLWTDGAGDPGAPVILLISGGATQAIGWSDEFVAALARGPRYVIRYDHRDVGLSSTCDFDADPYTLADLAADAAAVLDAHGVPSAHVVGVSMGAMVGQQLAIDNAERVLSLTSMCSTPAGASSSRAILGLPPIDDLPLPSADFLSAVRSSLLEPAGTADEQIERGVRAARTLTGSAGAFDEEYVRSLLRRSLERASDPAAAANHARMAVTAPDRRRALGRLTVPTVVIHGSDDPVYPLAHGEATAAAIQGSRLHVIDGLGHELPPCFHAVVAALILDHTSRAAETSTVVNGDRRPAGG